MEWTSRCTYKGVFIIISLHNLRRVIQLWSLEVEHEELLPYDRKQWVGSLQLRTKLRPPIDAQVVGCESSQCLKVRKGPLEYQNNEVFK